MAVRQSRKEEVASIQRQHEKKKKILMSDFFLSGATTKEEEEEEEQKFSNYPSRGWRHATCLRYNKKKGKSFDWAKIKEENEFSKV